MISCNTHSFKRSFKSLQKGLSIICPPSCDCENMILNQPSKTKFRVSFTSKKAHLPHNLGNLVNKLIIFILLHIEDPPLGNSIEEFPSSLRDQLGGMTTITAMSLSFPSETISISSWRFLVGLSVCGIANPCMNIFCIVKRRPDEQDPVIIPLQSLLHVYVPRLHLHLILRVAKLSVVLTKLTFPSLKVVSDAVL